MKSARYLIAAMLMFSVDDCGGVSVGAKPIIAGFDAESAEIRYGEEHFKNYAKYGMNSQFWVVRMAPQMKLSLDENGQVVGYMPDEKKRFFIDRAKIAQKYGVDLYLVTSYGRDTIKQLEDLGGFTKAYVQGPTRYIAPGEHLAPCPIEERFWLGQVLCEAKFAAELSQICPNVKGFLIDSEMYAGDMMWRNNSSFDDQTFGAVIEQMRTRKLLADDINAAGVERDKRYDWLEANGLVRDYFSIEEDLVADIAGRFRKEIDAINPDFQLGFYPYEICWFSRGWARGLATGKPAALLLSGEEYNPGFTPGVIARAEQVKKTGLNVRYLPGLFFIKQSPKELTNHLKQCLDTVNGYWMFTTYCLWQNDPEKLHGPYLPQADRQQYWEALGKANSGAISAYPDERFTTPGYTLLTNNEFYPGPKLDLPLKESYSHEPDVMYFEDPERTKLFDGGEMQSIGTVAWGAKIDEEISAVVDLSEPMLLERIRFDGGHILSYYPSVVNGSIEILTSMDGKMYYPIATENLLGGRGKDMPDMDYDKLGIRARYVKIVFKAKEVKKYSVWSISELAVWGTP